MRIKLALLTGTLLWCLAFFAGILVGGCEPETERNRVPIPSGDVPDTLPPVKQGDRCIREGHKLRTNTGVELTCRWHPPTSRLEWR